jgi:hypothetical protein
LLALKYKNVLFAPTVFLSLLKPEKNRVILAVMDSAASYLVRGWHRESGDGVPVGFA